MGKRKASAVAAEKQKQKMNEDKKKKKKKEVSSSSEVRLDVLWKGLTRVPRLHAFAMVGSGWRLFITWCMF
jgi:RNA-binding protein YlmH